MSATPAWTTVTVAFVFGALQCQQVGQRPIVRPSTTARHVGPTPHTVVRQQPQDARRGARQRRVEAHHQASQVVWQQAIGILVRMDPFHRLGEIQPRRKRGLQDGNVCTTDRR